MSRTESFDSLWSYCTANRRAVLAPQRWNELFDLLRDKHPLPTGGWEPPLPLILAAWHHIMPVEKQLRFREHIEWARDHGQLDEIGRFLRGLREEDWCHFGEF